MANKSKRSIPPFPENFFEPTEHDGHGSEYAPTARATESEAGRHASEEAHGHFAAGVDGRVKAIDVELDGGVDRDDEDESSDDDEVTSPG